MHKGFLWGGVLFTVGVVLAVAANYHFVYGSEVDGITVESKPSLSLSETLINLDTLGGMPMIMARGQYPMYVTKLERRIEMQKLQSARGCHNIYVGMNISEIIPKCGQPDVLKVSGGDSDMRWDTGVRIKTSGDKVIFVSSK